MKGRKIPSGTSYSIRMTPDLYEIARELGSGSVASHGSAGCDWRPPLGSPDLVDVAQNPGPVVEAAGGGRRWC